MKPCDLTNTFTERKIHEIACLIEGKHLPPKKTQNIEIILGKFENMKEVYKFLLETSEAFDKKNAYIAMLSPKSN